MIDKDRILAKIKDRGCKTVGVQYPEGLKREVVGLAQMLQDEGYEVVMSGDPCYGACDLSSMHCDLLIHLGHAPLGGTSEPGNVIFEEVPTECDLKVLDKCVQLLKSPVGLVTNVQHVHQLPEVKQYLEAKGFDVLIGQGGHRAAHDGQVLGCDFSVAHDVKDRVQIFLYLGTGDFHPLGVALATGKTVVAADPVSNEVKAMDELKDRFLRQRFGAIELAKNAQRFGILVSGKSGQSRLDLARRLREDLTRAGKKAFILYVDNVVPENLEGYDLDAYVCTACPRVAIDDYLRFKRPIINPKELEVALGTRSWDDYRIEEL